LALSFRLPSEFVDQYRDKKPSFGFNGLGEFVFRRTYSRDGEDWVDVCERVINGMYSIQKEHADRNGVNWNDEKANRSAESAFDSMFQMKWTPPGRGLWMMGTEFIHDRHQYEALNNCAFISSLNLNDRGGDFFRWVMEMSMLGVGVGFDTRGASTVEINQPTGRSVYTIPDSREGWAQSVSALFDSYLNGGHRLSFDYSKIRPAGSPISGFGGVASGPEPLRQLHESMGAVLEKRIGQKITSRDIVDICNLIGKCVIAGNVRRSAEIAIGEASDNEFLNLKNYDLNPERADYGWVSNNTVLAVPGETDYTRIAEGIWRNGEPGVMWLDNVQLYGRMNGSVGERADNATGGNPCLEQFLADKEMCTLSEIHMNNINSKEELAEAVKYAYLYGKTVTLASEFITDSESRQIMLANRRIGLSMTGQQQFAAWNSISELAEYMDYGYGLTLYYDDVYSDWLKVEKSIRHTSVKPSGTVSLLSGATPGIHWPISRFYIRRVNVAANSVLAVRMREAGYNVVPSVVDPTGTLVVEFPVDCGPGLRAEKNVSLTEQLEFVALAQRWWADNGVSATIKFNKTSDSPADIASALSQFDGRLKAISFLPNEDHGYAQAPYEEITKEEYDRRASNLKTLNLGAVDDQALDLFCDTDTCEIPEFA
jgi:ribonucleoside-triphosphate reductase